MTDFMAEHDRLWKEFNERDAAAKDADELIGRYIQESIADGYAYYVITERQGESMVQVEHIDYLDGYNVPMIDSADGLIPLKYALENIARRDRWAEYFNRRAELGEDDGHVDED